MALLLNNLLLTAAAATVLLGTLYPLLLDVVAGQKVSVGPPFFNLTFVPIMVPLLVAMGVGPMLPWKRGDLWAALSPAQARLRDHRGGRAGRADRERRPVGRRGMRGWRWRHGCSPQPSPNWRSASGCSAVRLASLWRRARHLPRAAWGMTLAHAGMAIVIAGIAGSSAWTEEKIVSARPGQSFDLAGYQIALDAVNPVSGPDYAAIRADMRLMRDGRRSPRCTRNGAASRTARRPMSRSAPTCSPTSTR